MNTDPSREAMALGVSRFKVRLDLPRESLESERALAQPDYVIGDPVELPLDPNAMEARFIDPVTMIVVMTLAVMAERVLHFALAKHGNGVMVDARQSPPHVSVLAGVPQGFVVLIHPDGRTETIRADITKDELSGLIGGALKLAK